MGVTQAWRQTLAWLKSCTNGRTFHIENCLAGDNRELEGLNSEQMDCGMIECLLLGYN